MNLSSFKYVCLLFVSAAFLPAESYGRELREGERIVLVNHSNIQFCSMAAVSKNGSVKRNIHKYVTDAVRDLDTLKIDRKIDDFHYVINVHGNSYLMAYDNLVGNSVNPHEYCSLEYYPVELLQEWNDRYGGQVFYNIRGEEKRCLSTGFKPGYNGNIYVVKIKGDSNYQDAVYMFDPFSESYENGIKRVEPDTYPDIEKHFVLKSTVDSWFENSVPKALVDSLRKVIEYGDTLYLARSLNDIDRQKIFRSNGRTFCSFGKYKRWDSFRRYTACFLSDLHKNHFLVYDREPIAKSLRFGYFCTLTSEDGTKYPDMLPVESLDGLFLSKNEVKAYKDSLEVERQKTLNAEANATARWIARQKELNEYEIQLQSLLKSAYGEEAGMNIWWGKIRFGYTEEMCKHAYRHCGPYMEKNHVDTPFGEARRIHFLEEQTMLYFINDQLVGIAIYGKTRWSDVLF